MFFAGLIAGVSVALTINSIAEEKVNGAFTLLAAGGQCEYGRSENGMWHQQGEGREVSADYRPRCGKIGFGYRPAKSPWGFSAMYFDGGRAHLSALAINYPDDDASKHDPSLDPLREECRTGMVADCMHRIRGSGNIRGVNLSASYDLFTVWKVTTEVGAGISVYRSSWDVRVLPMDPDCLGDDSKCKWQANINQRTNWLLSPTAQVKFKYAPFFLETQWQFRTVQHAPISAGYSKTLRGIFVGLEVPFWRM